MPALSKDLGGVILDVLCILKGHASGRATDPKPLVSPVCRRRPLDLPAPQPVSYQDWRFM